MPKGAGTDVCPQKRSLPILRKRDFWGRGICNELRRKATDNRVPILLAELLRLKIKGEGKDDPHLRLRDRR